MALELVVACVERLANGPRHRKARDRRRLASEGLSAGLDLEESSAHGPAVGRSRAARINSEDGAAESALGRAADARRAAQIGRAGLTGNRCEVHDAASDTAVAVVAHVPEQSHRPDRCRRFLRRPDGHLSPAVRARPSRTRAPPNRPCRCHRASHGSLDRAAIPRGVSVGSGTALSHSRPRSGFSGGRRDGDGYGHQRTPHRAALPMAERLRRTVHRLSAPRVPGSCDRVQRRRSARNPDNVRGVLHEFAHAPLAGEGLAFIAADQRARRRACRRDSSGRPSCAKTQPTRDRPTIGGVDAIA
jgi:hypothetical protein